MKTKDSSDDVGKDLKFSNSAISIVTDQSLDKIK